MTDSRMHRPFCRPPSWPHCPDYWTLPLGSQRLCPRIPRIKPMGSEVSARIAIPGEVATIVKAMEEQPLNLAGATVAITAIERRLPLSRLSTEGRTTDGVTHT